MSEVTQQEYFVNEKNKNHMLGPHLSQAWHSSDGLAVGLCPSDVGQWDSSGLADDLRSCRVAEVHIVGRLLYEHRT